MAFGAAFAVIALDRVDASHSLQLQPQSSLCPTLQWHNCGRHGLVWAWTKLKRISNWNQKPNWNQDAPRCKTNHAHTTNPVQSPNPQENMEHEDTQETSKTQTTMVPAQLNCQQMVAKKNAKRHFKWSKWMSSTKAIWKSPRHVNKFAVEIEAKKTC